MIVIKDRKKLAAILQQYLYCEIDSYTVEDSLFSSNDMLVREISYEVEVQFDETKSSFCRNSQEQKVIERFILLLDSDFDFPDNYRPVVHSEGVFFIRLCSVIFDLIKSNFCVHSVFYHNPYWPFSSISDLNEFLNKKKNPLNLFIGFQGDEQVKLSNAISNVDQASENMKPEEENMSKPDDKSCL